MTLDIYSIIIGAIPGIGFGVLVGFFLGLYAYGKVNKETFTRMRSVLSLKK